MRSHVTVENAFGYLERVAASVARLEEETPPGELACLMSVTAERVEALFREAPPLDEVERVRIALHEWLETGRTISIALAHRVKRAILNVGVYRLIQGLAAAWDVRRPAAERKEVARERVAV